MISKIECFNERLKRVEDYVAVEVKVNIYGNDRFLATLNCSPEKLEYLAIGYLIDMGYTIYEGIKRIEVRYPKIFAEFEICRRKREISNFKFRIEEVFRLMDYLSSSEVWKLTGGIHTALIHCNGDTFICEDVSRSCAVDKVVGLAAKRGVDFDESILVVSCRISEIIAKKAANAGIPVVASRTAVTTAGIEVAKENGITLLGFVRNGTAKVYTNPWRFGKA